MRDLARGNEYGARDAQARQGETVDYTLANQDRYMGYQSRGKQDFAGNMMLARAMGLTPSIANMQAERDAGRLRQQQASAAASARGPGGLAMAQQNSAANMAAGQSNISQSAQIAAANERLAAEQAAHGAFSGQRGQDLQSQAQVAQQSQYQTGVNARQREANDAYDIQRRNLGMGYERLGYDINRAEQEGGLRNREIDRGMTESSAARQFQKDEGDRSFWREKLWPSDPRAKTPLAGQMGGGSPMAYSDSEAKQAAKHEGFMLGLRADERTRRLLTMQKPTERANDAEKMKALPPEKRALAQQGIERKQSPAQPVTVPTVVIRGDGIAPAQPDQPVPMQAQAPMMLSGMTAKQPPSWQDWGTPAQSIGQFSPYPEGEPPPNNEAVWGAKGLPAPQGEMAPKAQFNPQTGWGVGQATNPPEAENPFGTPGDAGTQSFNEKLGGIVGQGAPAADQGRRDQELSDARARTAKLQDELSMQRAKVGGDDQMAKYAAIKGAMGNKGGGGLMGSMMDVGMLASMSDPRAKTPMGGPMSYSDEETKEPKGLGHFMQPSMHDMAEANRSMAPYEYAYKPEMTPPEQVRGEPNVGPMADKMERDNVAGVAVKRDPHGMRMIDTNKALKLTMGSVASLQKQIDQMKKARGR